MGKLLDDIGKHKEKVVAGLLAAWCLCAAWRTFSGWAKPLPPAQQRTPAELVGRTREISALPSIALAGKELVAGTRDPFTTRETVIDRPPPRVKLPLPPLCPQRVPLPPLDPSLVSVRAGHD